jgi:hypothetical protein
VLTGNGDGTFQRALKFSAVGGQCASLVVADFDSDGKQDLAVTTYNPSYGGLAVLYGKGDGTFQPPSYYDVLSLFPVGVAAGDFNIDGGVDLAVITASPDSLAILLNTTGRGGPAAPPGGGLSPRAPALHNVPRTGLVDLVGYRIAGTATASLAASPTPGRFAARPDLDVRQVDRVFALVSEKGRRSAVPRLTAQRNPRPDWAMEFKALDAEPASSSSKPKAS